VLASMTGEVEAEYVRAVRRATLDYVLRSPAERARLGISQLPPGCEPRDWGWSAGRRLFEAPRFWRASFHGMRVARQDLHLSAGASRF
jgi:hypothetical protein